MRVKWVAVVLAVLCLVTVAVGGSLGDRSSDEKYLCIVQSELQRGIDGLTEVEDNRSLVRGIYDVLTTEEVLLEGDFFATAENGQEEHTLSVKLSSLANLYTADGALDHIVVVSNIGNVPGYVRTWFAFEMGDLTAEEFKASVLLNCNEAAWRWDEFEYGVEIDGGRYAVVCAEYKTALAAEATTEPSLLQILLCNTVDDETARRLDGNRDGKYEVKAFSRAVSDKGAWGAGEITDPWSN